MGRTHQGDGFCFSRLLDKGSVKLAVGDGFGGRRGSLLFGETSQGASCDRIVSINREYFFVGLSGLG